VATRVVHCPQARAGRAVARNETAQVRTAASGPASHDDHVGVPDTPHRGRRRAPHGMPVRRRPLPRNRRLSCPTHLRQAVDDTKHVHHGGSRPVEPVFASEELDVQALRRTIHLAILP
jgi:hypothetical protein